MIDKIKFDYIIDAWMKEQKRDDKIEDKAKFIFSVLTLILGGLFLKYELIAQIIKVTKDYSEILLCFILITMVLIGLGVLLSLYFIFKVITVQGYRPMFPLNTLQSLYDRDSCFFENNSEEQFYDSMGKFITSSFEYNVIVIQKKAQNIKRAWTCLLVSLGLVMILFVLWMSINTK